jgi:hypothetical protein
MMSTSIAATKRVKRTVRELQNDELDCVSGGGEAVTFTLTVTNTSFRGGVALNETITIGGARTE